MGVSGSVGATEIATAFRDATLNRQIPLAGLVILYWDFIVTFSMEVERYWGRRFAFSWPTVCFLGCRYLALIGHIPVLFQIAQPVNNESLCPKLLAYHQVFILVGQVFVGIMMNIRTYALYGRSRKIQIAVWTLSVIVLAIGSWGIFSSHSESPTEPAGVGCNVALSPSQGAHIAVAWGCLLLYDITIFSLTLYKTLALRTGSRGLVDVMLRDGAMYFGYGCPPPGLRESDLVSDCCPACRYARSSP